MTQRQCSSARSEPSRCDADEGIPGPTIPGVREGYFRGPGGTFARACMESFDQTDARLVKERRTGRVRTEMEVQPDDRTCPSQQVEWHGARFGALRAAPVRLRQARGRSGCALAQIVVEASQADLAPEFRECPRRGSVGSVGAFFVTSHAADGAAGLFAAAYPSLHGACSLPDRR